MKFQFVTDVEEHSGQEYQGNQRPQTASVRLVGYQFLQLDSLHCTHQINLRPVSEYIYQRDQGSKAPST